MKSSKKQIPRWDLFKKLSKRLTEVEVGQNSFGQLLIQSKAGQKFWHLAEKPSLTLSFKFELTLIQSKVAWTQAAQSFLSPYDAPNLARYLWTAIEYIYQNLYIFKNQSQNISNIFESRSTWPTICWGQIGAKSRIRCQSQVSLRFILKCKMIFR